MSVMNHTIIAMFSMTLSRVGAKGVKFEGVLFLALGVNARRT
jgi:hypothetical protein